MGILQILSSSIYEFYLLLKPSQLLIQKQLLKAC